LLTRAPYLAAIVLILAACHPVASQQAPTRSGSYIVPDDTVPPGEIHGRVIDSVTAVGIRGADLVLRAPVNVPDLRRNSYASLRPDGSFILRIPEYHSDVISTRAIGYTGASVTAKLFRNRGYRAQVAMIRDTVRYQDAARTGELRTLCVVDGAARELRMPATNSWPRECTEIDSIAVLDYLSPAEATLRYGVRGASGAMVFTSKRYRHDHPLPSLGVKDFDMGTVLELPEGRARVLMAQMTVARKSPKREVKRPPSSDSGVVVGFVDGGNTANLLIATDIPAANTDALIRQARAVVDSERDLVTSHRLARIVVIVCRTTTCANSSESSEEMFAFERSGNGWVYKPDFFKDPC